MSATRTGLLLAATACLLMACAGLRGEPAPAEEERLAYARAVASIVDDPEGTERALEEFVAIHPDSPLADDASVRLGELAAARGDADAALVHYERAVQRHPNGDRADVARVEIARLQQARGDDEKARAVLRRVRLSRLSGAERRGAYRVMADVAEDSVSKLRWLAKLRGAESDEDALALVDVEIDELLQRMDEPDLVRAAGQLGSDIPAARVWLRAASLALDRGDVERARHALERAEDRPLAPPYEGRLSGVSARLQLATLGELEDIELPSFQEVAGRELPETSSAVGVIGVVLPLTGPFARFAEESLQGVLLAAGVFGGAEAAPRIRVLVRDSAGRPERAARAVRDLSSLGVVAIVGPLLKGECEAAAAAAESEGVPMVALTARPEVSATRPNVFRVRTMPSEEAAALADHAMGELGARRFAILYPRDAYGRGLRRLFFEAVEQRGGQVVGIASYDPDATDFAGPIRRLVGYTLLSAAEKKLIEEREDLERKARRLPPEEAASLREEARAMLGPDEQPLPPIVDFDALFIPESYDKVVLIAPQLAFHEAVGMTLLGPNGWHHPDLVPIAREHVEGARFTAHFYAESTLPFVRDFNDRYQEAYASGPDVFAAQAYDATNLVLVQLARGRETRDEVREGVLSVTAFPGVTGVLTMRSDGNARKRPYLLAVEHGRIRQLE